MDSDSTNNQAADASRQNILTFSGFQLPTLDDEEAYITFPEESIVSEILAEAGEGDLVSYEVLFEDGHTEKVPFEHLISLENGQDALSTFHNRGGEADHAQHDASARSSVDVDSETEGGNPAIHPISRIRRTKPTGFTKPAHLTLSSSEDEISAADNSLSRHRARRDRSSGAQRSLRSRSGATSNSTANSQSSRSSDDDPEERRKVRRNQNPTGRATRSSLRSQRNEPDYVEELVNDSSSHEELELLQSDILPRKRKRKQRPLKFDTRGRREIGGLKFDKTNNRPKPSGMRKSERSTRHVDNMQEAAVTDIYRSDSEGPRPAPKLFGAREAFQPLPRGNKFAARHCQQCDSCGNYGSGPHGQLIHCQGCSLSYHRTCLRDRGTRDHLVTKVGHADFVLQCRRCISVPKRKDATAPEQGMCQTCREIGSACRPFRVRKTVQQEHREREENGGDDPIIPVKPELLNNAENVLFRCTGCWRAFHFQHLLSKDDIMDTGEDEESIAEDRYKEYARDWQCRECTSARAKVSGLIAWRPVDPDTYTPGLATQDISEDDKEYLVKWEKMSYFQAQWMPGAWAWGVTAPPMRHAFAKKRDGMNLPTMTAEDAIPEDYLRIDIVLDVRFTSIVDTRAEEVDKARIREVDKALVKYKGLGYEDAVWEKVPDPQDGDRWTDFVSAYDDWVRGRYVRIPKAGPLKARLEKARSLEFTAHEKKKQPESLVGGEMMKYQMDGVNWLYYRWFSKQNAILADEMGLGKTIQLIGLLATLVQDHNCFPFLVVVPNSTCPNWRREIKQWSPSLRVVTYFGSSLARSMAYQYEMFPEGSKELRCHVVVTSYDAAADDTCRRFFRSVPWQGLIVDEGQRLKSDKNILYNALSTLRIPYRVLLTGTPLQNNARELFNLLQFLDESFDAAALELQYEELTKDNIPQLHNLIRPFFLRRTKAQVLTFLPPMAQIIIPVSMSVVQKKLYMSILAKNPDLLRAILGSGRALKQGERGSLSNILMQLRKCLCHPFVYSKEIEERSVTAAVSHRNLVEASSKLQLLEILLSKLKDRGHRVLIFSQFLGMLDIVEDFLDGLALRHQRLDGTVSSLQKQKRIDEFNAPDSPLFAFLLSTRAGGVGINLATADTVIILDPDFNPHQDIQALSRAHRIGQKNKVLCFQLMTQASAEEKIVQIGRKKMALDHVLIERMDADEDDATDMESILRHGAAQLLEGDANDVRYDDASVEKLLDRSQIENTKAGEDNSAESQFSYARVWANDSGTMLESIENSENDEKPPDAGVWEGILKERERVAAAEAAARQQALGRGKRARHTVDYSTAHEVEQGKDSSNHPKAKRDSGSDTDFQAEEKSEIEESQEEDNNDDVAKDAKELSRKGNQKHAGAILGAAKKTNEAKRFQRSNVLWTSNIDQPPREFGIDGIRDEHNTTICIACSTWHRVGYCPLKLAGPEFCSLCGLAHYGIARSCPHIRSETQVREMLAALKQSPEPRHLIEAATRYLQGVKGSIVQDKKRKAQQLAMANANGQSQPGLGSHYPDGSANARPIPQLESRPPDLPVGRVDPSGAPQHPSFMPPQPLQGHRPAQSAT